MMNKRKPFELLSRLKLINSIVVIVLTTAHISYAAETFAGEPVATFSIEVDFGKDTGQSFGSLFEVRDKQNRVVAGAGFLDVYNTRFRSARHTLQFFVRPGNDPDKFSSKRLPHPDLDCGIYLLDHDQKVQAWSRVRNNTVRLWSPETQEWTDAPIPKTGRVGSGDGMMRLGDGVLTFTSNSVAFNDRVILKPPSSGRYYNFYYAQGRLFFYHTHKSDQGGFTKIYACPWTTDSPDPIDLSQTTVMQAKYVGATPFAWGQFRDEVLTVSNYGGVYAFGNSKWKTIKEALKGVSFQVYSMLNYHDRLLLAQYPTGELFEYRGKELKHIKGWPPKLPGVSTAAREAQTMAIYRGDLIVGVWPWAEVWRYNHDEDRWSSMGRLFSHPELTDKQTHPYEAEARKFKLVANHWGQRVTSMVPINNSLMLSTSSKGTYQWFDKYDFLSESQRREYGSVIQLQMPGNLAAQMQWQNRPIKLEFVVEENRILVRQDGKTIAQTELQTGNLQSLQQPTINWGQGVYGELNGTVKSKKVTVSKR